MGEVTAAIYARVSTEQQTRGNTVASQLALLRDRAETDEVRLDPDHTFVDEGYSGSTLVRPALERLRDAVADSRIDRVYILAPDRLARRYAYQVLLVEEFRRSGAEVVFLNRSIGGSAEDDLLLQVQGVIAEYERAKILERGRRGRRHAAQTGAVSALCGAPFGYRYIGRHAGGGLARVEPCGDEARIVRSIFRWVGVDRISLREVCRRLLKMGCVTRTGKVRWDPTTICGMLRNPVYRGTAMFGRTRSMPAKPRLRPIGHRPQPPRRASGSRSATPREEWIEIPVPALIDEALFEAAQIQLEENRKRKREGRRRPGWLLQGLVVCRRCGYAFYGKMARGLRGNQRPADYGYYRCTGTDAHRFGGQATCDNRSVRSDKLDQAVWAEVQTVLKDPTRLAGEYRRRISEAQTGGAARDDLNTLDGQIARLRSGIERLIDSYAEGIIGRVEFEPRINGLKRRIGRLENDRKALTEKLELERDLVLVIGRLEEFTSRLQTGLSELDWSARRDVIRALVRRIEIDHDKIEVIFRVPGPSPEGGTHSRPPSPTDPGPPNWQHCGNVHCGFIGKDADDIGSTLDLAVQSFQWVCAVDLGAVLLWECCKGEHVGFGIVHQTGELRHSGSQLIGDGAPLRAGGIGVVLGEGGADPSGDNAPLCLAGMRHGIAHEVDAAALPGGIEHASRRGLEALVSIRDDQLDAAQAAPCQAAQEVGPEGFGLAGADCDAEYFAAPVAVHAHRDDHRHRYDTAVLAYLHVGGVEPHIGPVALDRSMQKGLHAFIDLGTQPRDLAFGDAGAAHGLHQVIDAAC